MSEALVLTGKRGQGKTLVAVGKIARYMSEGRRIATNLDLYVENLVNASNRVRPYRLPDHPCIHDLEALPLGNPDPKNEKKNGLLVLDEASTFLNSRTWDKDKSGRLAVVGWLAQSRKFGWDLIVIAQHVNMIDAQIRESLFEHYGVCVNLEGMLIPVLSRFSGGFIRFPKVHRLAVRLGFHPRAPLVEHEFFKGEHLYDGYNTLQVINPSLGVPQGGGYSMLSAYDIKGRYMSWWQRMKKIIIAVASLGFLIGVFFSETRHYLKPSQLPSQVDLRIQKSDPVYEDVTVFGTYTVNNRTHVLLSDKRDVAAISVQSFSDGRREFEIAPGVWVKGMR
jgi:hypothetical protein